MADDINFTAMINTKDENFASPPQYFKCIFNFHKFKVFLKSFRFRGLTMTDDTVMISSKTCIMSRHFYISDLFIFLRSSRCCLYNFPAQGSLNTSSAGFTDTVSSSRCKFKGVGFLFCRFQGLPIPWQ